MISSNVGSNLYEVINKNLFLFRYNKYKKDNIGYILHDPFTRTLTGIDFGDFTHTKKITEMIERKYNSKLKYLISTHSHYDHTDGNKLWKKYRENTLQILGGYSPDKNDTIPYADKLYKENQIISLGGGAFERKENRKMLNDNGKTIYLRLRKKYKINGFVVTRKEENRSREAC